MPRDWSRLVVKGSAQVIPPLCPNCLAQGTEKLRCGYKGWEGWLTRTTYYQTFTYCKDCLPQARSSEGLRKWLFLAGFVAVAAWIAALIAVSQVLPGPEAGKGGSFDLAMALSIPVGLAAGVLAFLAVRALKRRKHPVRPAQACWGRAAFYTGHSGLGTKGDAVYIAARREWIVALAKANPDQVEESVYQGLTGSARPVPERPFGQA